MSILDYLKPFEAPFSSGAKIFGVRVFGASKPVREWLLYPLNRVAKKIDRMFDFVKLRTTHRDCWTIKMAEPRWYDPDEMMLQACFVLLGKYITWHGDLEEFEVWSKELLTDPDENAPEGLQSSQGGRQLEALALWRWWTKERPARHKAHDEEKMLLFGRNKDVAILNLSERRDAHHKEENAIHEEDQKMLHRLIDIRPSLWL